MLEQIKNLSLGVLLISSVIILNACDSPESRLPKELELRKPEYEFKRSVAFGPGGSNHSIRVYELPQNTIVKLKASGLQFLNQMPSTVNYQTRMTLIDQNQESLWKPFKHWQMTPVKVDAAWIRKTWVVGFHPIPTLNQFFAEKQNSTFLFSIPVDVKAVIDKMVQQPGNYYAYGGYRNNSILILSPTNKKALYLFRD
ncbi:MAG: hypothetical protein AB7I18_07980 [Candidatus Berkiella sp.]